jgi:hypothetical protein
MIYEIFYLLFYYLPCFVFSSGIPTYSINHSMSIIYCNFDDIKSLNEKSAIYRVLTSKLLFYVY